MFVFIFKPENKQLTKTTLENAHKKGGAIIGVCYPSGKGEVYKRTFTEFDKFYAHYEIVKDNNLLMYFDSEEEKSQRSNFFAIDRNHVMLHGGKIWDDTDLCYPKYSQSYNFLQELKKIWNPTFFLKLPLLWIIKNSLPKDNYLAIMRGDGGVQLFSHFAWTKTEDCYFSHYVSTTNYTTPKTTFYFCPTCNRCTATVSKTDCYSCSFKKKNASIVRPSKISFLKNIIKESDMVDLADFI